MRLTLLALTLLVTALGTLGTPAVAQNDWLKELGRQGQQSMDIDFLPVEMAFPFSYDQQGSKLTLSWNVQPGYYLYRRSFRFPSNEAAIADSQLPVGNIVDDIEYGVTEVYEQPLEMQLQLAHAVQQVTIEFQGCAKAGLCYPPTLQTIFIDSFVADTATPDPLILTTADAVRGRIGTGLTTLVQLTADWSAASKLMQRTLFSQEAVTNALEPLLWVQADVTDRAVAEALLAEFEATGPDTFIFYSSTGEEQQRLVGRQTAETLLPVVEALTGNIE